MMKAAFSPVNKSNANNEAKIRRAANFPYKSPINETVAGEQRRSAKAAGVGAVADSKHGKSTSQKSIKGKRAADMPLKQPSVKRENNNVSSP